MKLITSVRCTRKAAKSIKIGTHILEIETEPKDCTTLDAKNIISLSLGFHVHTLIFAFLAARANQLEFNLALIKYAEHLIMLCKIYTWDPVWENHFNCYQTYMLEQKDD